MQRAGRSGATIFCDHLLRHRLVEAESATRRLSFEFCSRNCRSSRISARSHRAEFHLPSVKRCFGDHELADVFRHRCTGFGLA